MLVLFLTFGTELFAAVELSYFRVSITDSLDVEIEWGTELEDTAGFIVKRSLNGGPSEEISVLYNGELVSFIPASGGILGSDYVAVDETAIAGETYTYYLFEVEFDNTQKRVGSDQITIEEESSSTSITSNNNNNTGSTSSNSSATATPRPTSTLRPTSTPVASNNSSSNSDSSGSSDTSGSNNTSNGTSSRATITPSSQVANTPTAEPTTSIDNSSTETSETEETTVNIGEEESLETEESESVAVAVAQASETEQEDDYPVEPEIESSQVITEGYTPPTAVPNITVTPAEIGASDPTTGTTTETTETEEAADSDNAQLVLWGSFVAAFLLFISGVLGALLIFRRRRQEEQTPS